MSEQKTQCITHLLTEYKVLSHPLLQPQHLASLPFPPTWEKLQHRKGETLDLPGSGHSGQVGQEHTLAGHTTFWKSQQAGSHSFGKRVQSTSHSPSSFPLPTPSLKWGLCWAVGNLTVTSAPLKPWAPYKTQLGKKRFFYKNWQNSGAQRPDSLWGVFFTVRIHNSHKW